MPFLRQELIFPKKDTQKLRHHFESYLPLAKHAAQWIVDQNKQNQFPFLDLLFEPREDSDTLMHSLKIFFQTHFKRLFVLTPIGLSSSMRSLVRLTQSFWPRNDSALTHIVILDTLDPEAFWELVGGSDPKTTGVLMISQTGEEFESLLMLMRLIEYWKDFLTPEALAQAVTIIAPLKKTRAQHIGERFGFYLFDLPEELQLNPFFCLSWIAALPAAISGADIQKIRSGAAYFCHAFVQQKETGPTEYAALLAFLFQGMGISAQGCIPMSSILKPFGTWFCDVFSEKSATHTFHQRILCADALDKGPYLPNMALTLLSKEYASSESLAPELWASHPGLKGLAKASLNQGLHQKQEAYLSLMHQHYPLPIRLLSLSNYAEQNLGYAMAYRLFERLIYDALISHL